VHPAKVADGLIVRRLHNRIGSLGLLKGDGTGGWGGRSAIGRLYPRVYEGPGFWRARVGNDERDVDGNDARGCDATWVTRA
jgi:hypothetical protein